MANPVQANTSQVAQLRSQKSFFGHPKAIGTLSFMQLCNSFANLWHERNPGLLSVCGSTGRTGIYTGERSTAGIFVLCSIHPDRNYRKL